MAGGNRGRGLGEGNQGFTPYRPAGYEADLYSHYAQRHMEREARPAGCEVCAEDAALHAGNPVLARRIEDDTADAWISEMKGMGREEAQSAFPRAVPGAQVEDGRSDE